jgi:hypothetical protein
MSNCSRHESYFKLSAMDSTGDTPFNLRFTSHLLPLAPAINVQLFELRSLMPGNLEFVNYVDCWMASNC